jgi:hypothetical protein
VHGDTASGTKVLFEITSRESRLTNRWTVLPEVLVTRLILLAALEQEVVLERACCSRSGPFNGENSVTHRNIYSVFVTQDSFTASALGTA